MRERLRQCDQQVLKELTSLLREFEDEMLQISDFQACPAPMLYSLHVAAYTSMAWQASSLPGPLLLQNFPHHRLLPKLPIPPQHLIWQEFFDVLGVLPEVLAAAPSCDDFVIAART
jgi:hypothetical protein